eukprot:scaffold18827_cov117-Isochrysis_galbana.AAC.1
MPGREKRKVTMEGEMRSHRLGGVGEGALYTPAPPERLMFTLKKKLVRLKKPRLPSALGLSGACGVEA